MVSPEKKKAGSSPSLNGGSSGDDYRDKEDVESDYEESMEVDQAELQEGGGAPKAPPLARLQDGHNGDTARGPARKRHRGDPNERRREQERIDKRKIADLRAAAASINSPEAQALLHQAHHAGSRSERGRLILLPRVIGAMLTRFSTGSPSPTTSSQPAHRFEGPHQRRNPHRRLSWRHDFRRLA